MATDPTIGAIDSLYNFLDTNVERLDHALNRGKQIEEKHHARRGKRPEIIDAEAEPSPKTAPKSKATTVARKSHFYIVESISKSGETLFVVTDGGSARTECSTREFAETILRSLEAR